MYRKLLLILPVAVLLAAGCGGKQAGLTNPAFQPEIVNQTDSFSFQATNVVNVTQTVQYTWQNTGTTANVDHSSQITSGLATLTILDSGGQQVYMAPLSPTGTFATASGTAGGWTIQVVVSDLDATLNFSAQRP